MVRGKVVVDDGMLVGAKGYGTYLSRNKPPKNPRGITINEKQGEYHAICDDR